MARKKPYLVIRKLRDANGNGAYYLTPHENVTLKAKDDALAAGIRIASQSDPGLRDVELAKPYAASTDAATVAASLGFNAITRQKLSSLARGKQPIV